MFEATVGSGDRLNSKVPHPEVGGFYHFQLIGDGSTAICDNRLLPARVDSCFIAATEGRYIAACGAGCI